MKSELRAAFEAARCGYSPDRVVADPDLNESFLAECRRLGLADPPATLNRALLNLRKGSALSGLKSRKTSFAKEDEYRFAAEIAARFIERRDSLSLDDVICDPVLVAEFDRFAADISPGYTPLQYRWAAFNLRKAKRLAPELLGRVAPPIRVLAFRAAELDLSQIPTEQGLYLFYARDRLLYVGEAQNLRLRLKRHLDHSDRREFARWLWEFGKDDLHVEIQVLEQITESKIRRALELELIRSRRPVFNVQR